jgi:hypothetical protein
MLWIDAKLPGSPALVTGVYVIALVPAQGLAVHGKYQLAKKYQDEQESDGVRSASWHEAREICFVCCPEVTILRSHARLAYCFAAQHLVQLNGVLTKFNPLSALA